MALLLLLYFWGLTVARLRRELYEKLKAPESRKQWYAQDCQFYPDRRVEKTCQDMASQLGLSELTENGGAKKEADEIDFHRK